MSELSSDDPVLVDASGAPVDRSLSEPSDDHGSERPAMFAVPTWLDRSASWSWRLLLIALAVAAAVVVISRLRIVLVPALVALLVASLLGPPATALRRKGWPSLLATWTVLLTALVVVGGLLTLAILLIAFELVGGNGRWREVGDDIRTWLTEDAPVTLSSEQVDEAWESIRSAAINGIGGGTDAVRLLIELGSGLFLGIVLVFFFVNDGDSMWRWVLDHVAPHRRTGVDEAGRRAVTTLGAYVRGVAITGLIDGLLIGAVLLVLGVPLAIPLAIITFFGAFIPIVGATAAGMIAAVVALVTEGVTDAIIVAIAIFVIQQIEGDVIMPLVMRRQVRLHPAMVIVALATGGALAGIVGAFVAVPLAAAAVEITSTLRSAARRHELDAVP